MDKNSTNPNTTNTLLQAALAYATKLSWPVFPCVPGEKRPLTSHGVKDATTDIAQITEWWTRWPDANIGLACGARSGVTALDVDVKPWKGKHGDQTLAELVKTHGALPESVAQRTWSGGWQYLFKHAPGVRNDASGKVGKDIDVRNDDGYVIIPPSVVGEDALEGTYAWQSDPFGTPLAAMPGWLVERAQGWREGKDGRKRTAPENVRSAAAKLQAGVPGRNENAATVAIALRKAGLGEEQIDAAIRSLNDQSPEPLPDAEVDRLVRGVSARYEPLVSEDNRYTDQAHAERLAQAFGDRFRYCDETGRWYVFDGRRWYPTRSHVPVAPYINTLSKQFYLAAAQEPDADKAERYSEQGARLGSYRVVRNVIAQARSLEELQVREADFDRDELLLNVENGVVDLTTGKLLDHDPTRLMARMAPVMYDPDAVCELWEDTVRYAMGGDQELIGFLQRVLGYSLTGLTSEDAFFVAYGVPRSGKTTLVTAFATMLGDYATTLRAEALLAGGEQKIPHDLADLRGARFVVTSEAPGGRQFDDRLVKMLSGDDEITACHKHENNFRFYPQFKLVMYTNHRPRFTAKDEALWRRAKTIPFMHDFKDHPAFDLDVKEQLRRAESRAGILAWAVRGCLDWQRGGLRVPERVLEETRTHRKEVDEMLTFIEEQCVVCDRDPTSPESATWATVPELFRAYSGWARDLPKRSRLGQAEMVAELTRLGYPLGRRRNAHGNYVARVTGLRVPVGGVGA